MKEKVHLVSLSGGKDSTAMLLGMIDRDMPIDDILFFDWGKEFPGMYEHLIQLQEYVWRVRRKEITFLFPDRTFEYWLFLHKKDGSQYHDAGYGWPRSRARWCTAAKRDTLKRVVSQYTRKGFQVVEYIGYALDEYHRTQGSLMRKRNASFPLIDWQMTERDALTFCVDQGFSWGGLYDIFPRVSCFCCPLQSIPELFKVYKHFPDQWEVMKQWDEHTFNAFRQDYGLCALERRFSGMRKQADFWAGERRL